MQKSNQAKRLYQFGLRQKQKQESHSQTLNDSLDLLPHESLVPKLHHRTQSCPSVPPLENESSPDRKEQTARSHKGQPLRRSCQSQADLQVLSVQQSSVSMESLSSQVYRRSCREGGLKKGRGAAPQFKVFPRTEQFERVRLEQQMRKYALREELLELEQNSRDTSLKQQVLEALLHKCHSLSSSQLTQP